MKRIGTDIRDLVANWQTAIHTQNLGQKTYVRWLVTALVISLHALLLCLMFLDFDRTRPSEKGSEGVVVYASLVPSAFARLAAAAPAPLKQAAKTDKSVRAVKTEFEQTAEHVPDSRVPPITEVANLTPIESLGEQGPVDPILSDQDATALAAFTPASSQGSPDAPCNLVSAMASDFAQSAVVSRALGQLPLSDRSVANAVMIWDGKWAQETVTGGRALLRAIIVKEVSSSPASCLHTTNRGPMFFLATDGKATFVIAVGSGEWTWGDLVGTPILAALK